MGQTTALIDRQADANTLIEQEAVPTFTANIWRSSWVNVKAHRRATLILAMDQASAANGVVIQQSSKSTTPTVDADGWYWFPETTVNATDPVTSVNYHHVSMSTELTGKWARLVVKHDGTPPTTFYAVLLGNTIT